MRATGANGGIQYRSTHVEPKLDPLPDDLTPQQRQQRQQQQDLDKKHAKWNLFGYQADFDFETNTRANFTNRAHRVASSHGADRWLLLKREKSRRCLPFLASSDALKSVIKPGEWNQLEIIAEGNMLTHIINGHIMAILLDTDPEVQPGKGRHCT